MIKSNHSEKAKLLCWKKEAQQQSLCIEQANGELFIIPYVHLLYAHLGTENGKELLALTFSSHEIRIVGKALTDLAVAIQQFSVEWIKPLIPRYSESKRAGALVEKITISERVSGS